MDMVVRAVTAAFRFLWPPLPDNVIPRITFELALFQSQHQSFIGAHAAYLLYTFRRADV